MDMVKELESGAIGGLAGGTLMAAGMMIGKRAGMVNELPPAKLERELEDRGGFADKTDETQETALASAATWRLARCSARAMPCCNRGSTRRP
jgi:hypothetical protein